jgi:hypothetical protein
MPEAIIRDPKMNPVESRYGILYSPGDGEYFAYDKISKKDQKRYWIGGLKVNFSRTEPIDHSIDYDGRTITRKVENDVHISPDEKKNKVYRKIIKLIEKDKSLFDGLDSEVPD